MTGAADRLKPLLWRAVRFGIVGLGSVGVYFIALYLLRSTLSSTIVLTSSAYVISAVFNFILQNTFTFQSRTIHSGKIAKYIAMHALCMMINSSVMYLLVDLAAQNLYVAQLLTTVLVAITSFAISSRYVYKD